MAQRVVTPVRFKPSGGQDWDSDPLERGNGNYHKGKNIHFLTRKGSSTFSVIPSAGNTQVFTLPTVVPQNVIFRIYLDCTEVTPTQRTLQIFDANSVLLGTANYTPSSGSLGLTYNTAVSAINAALSGQAFTIGLLQTTTANASGYFSLEITTISFWEYSLQLTTTGSEPLPIITQEAIDNSLAGKLKFIGSYDLDEDLWIQSTTQRNLPSTLTIPAGHITNSGGQVAITISNHGQATGNKVIVSDVTGIAGLPNGTWIITRLNANTFILNGSVWVNPYSGGTVIINPSGIGEMGVVTKNENNSTWNYITLGRTKEWNWVTKKQPKSYAERNNLNAQYYWTDNYNYPGRFYYQGAYMPNGMLNYMNPLNTYAYGEIEQATRLISGVPNLHLTFTNQLQAGGGVLVGNHRYCIRLLDANFNATLYTDPTNEIPVYIADNTSIAAQAPTIGWGGNAAYLPTGKINQFLITGIIPNLFKYVELVDIYYADGAIVGTTVRRDLLTQNSTQIIQHVGTEIGTTSLDIATLSAITSDIATALNIDGVRNHLVLSNITSSVVIDFSAHAQTFKHRIVRDQTSVKAVGSPQLGNFQLGEYADPINVCFKLGHMHNEIYRYACKYRLKTGYITDTFWVDDIRIDTLSTNQIAHPTSTLAEDRRLQVSNSDGSCILGGLPNYDLTDTAGANGSPTVVYPAFVEFSQFAMDFPINGVQIRDLVDEIIIERVNISEDENLRDVITTGGIIKTVTNYPIGPRMTLWTNHFNPNDAAGQYTPTGRNVNGEFNVADTGGYTEYYGVSKWYFAPDYDTYASNGTNHFNAPSFAFFYSMDQLFGSVRTSFLPDDQVVNMGALQVTYAAPPTLSALGTESVLLPSTFAEFSGAEGRTWNTVQVCKLASNTFVPAAGSTTQSGVNFYRSLYYCKWDNSTGNYNRGYEELNPSASLLQVGTSTINEVPSVTYFKDVNGLSEDRGLHYVQYLRPRAGTLDNGKYGVRTASKYIPTGFSLLITTSTPTVIPVNTLNVFGGDVFTQKTYIKNRTPQVPNGTLVDASFNIEGGGSVFSIYSQNRVNTQMKENFATFTDWDYPNITATALVEGVSPAVVPVYNTGYSFQQDVTVDANFDPNLPRSNAQPARICYSLQKPADSIADQYTSFLPLNYTDLDLSFGPIEHHKNINSELVTWQWDKVEQQFFETTGLMSANSTDVVLGNAGIMTRVGKTLSTYGTKHGFSVCVGKTSGGKDVATWLDVIHGKYMRHAMEDGTVVLSDMHTMRSFFNNYFQFADLVNTPADGQGVCSGYDHQNSEFITTVRAHKQVDYFDPVSGYVVGEAVQLTVQPPGTYSTFEETIEIYECRQGYIVPNGNYFPETGADWQTYWKKISHDDIDYFNEFTFSFNQEKEKFTTFYSFLPKIYLQRGKSFLTPRPIDNESQCYEHLREDSELCVWYNDGTTEQAEKWCIEGMCINHDANLNKHAMAILMQVDIVPEYVGVESKSYKTFMLAADFSTDHDQFKVAVKNDILTADNTLPIPVNEQDTSFIFGSYFNLSLSGSPRIYQKFYNFIMKVRNMTRFYNS